MTSPVVICTLDGVLCDDRRRRRLKNDGRMEDYHAAVLEDVPIWPTLRILRGMQASGCEIILIENRPESSAAATKKWLNEFSVDYDWLFLGPHPKVTKHLSDDGGQIFAAIVGNESAEKFYRTHMHRPFVYRISQEGLCYP